MKKFSALLGLLLCVCGGHARTTRVSGIFRSAGDTVCYRCYNLSDRSQDVEEPVEIPAPGGKFSFELPDKDAVYSVLMWQKMPWKENTPKGEGNASRKTSGNRILFMVFPGEQVEIADAGNAASTSSPTYKKYAGLRPVLQGYREQAKRCDREGLQDSVKAYNEMVRETVLGYIKAHPGDPFSTFLIDKEVPDADARDAYNMLDASLREGKIGAYVSDAVIRKAAKEAQAAAEKLYAEAEKKQLGAGDAFPGLSFTDMDGKDFSWSSLKGKYVYIDVWATWCAPCKNELPFQKKLAESLAGKNIAFVSVSMDADRAAWKMMVENENLGGIHLHAGGTRDVFGKFFGFRMIPHFILLDKEGRVLDTNMSRPSNPETEKALLALEGL